MIEVFTGHDEVQYPGLFRRMYRQRYEIYVKRRKWKGLKPVDDMEKDQYDTADAVYLIALDEDDEILAALRLLPSEGPHIFGDLFPHLAGPAGVPTGEEIFELTRFYVAPSATSKETRDWLIGVLCSGLIEYCLGRGITRISSVIDTFLLKLMLSMDWTVKPLGLPQRYPEGIAVAVLIEMQPEMLVSTRRSKNVSGPVLSRMGFPIPRIPRTLTTPGRAPGSRLH